MPGREDEDTKKKAVGDGTNRAKRLAQGNSPLAAARHPIVVMNRPHRTGELIALPPIRGSK